MSDHRAWFTAVLLCLCGLSSPVRSQMPDEMKPASMSAGFWHLGLVVRDLDTMDRFYARVIGLEQVTDLFVHDARVEHPHEGAIVVQRLDELMGLLGTQIAIHHYSDPTHTQFLELLHYPSHPAGQVQRATNKPLGWNHLGLEVDDIDRVLQAMQAEQLGELLGGPSILPEFGGKRYAFIMDPEGNLIELVEAQR
jgi:catechol 2,3-dioxygenase-like lactoylglutathione lyase family enzyme